MSMPLYLAKQTGQNILPQDKANPSTTVLCLAQTVQVVNFVILLLGNRIKGKETTIVEPLLEVSSHVLPCMYLAALERQIPNHSGMQTVWWVQTRYNYTIRKHIIGNHLQKAALGRDGPIPPQWFISYNCNYLFERAQRVASHQMCVQQPDIPSTLFLEERRNKWRWLFRSNNKDLAQSENDPQ